MIEITREQVLQELSNGVKAEYFECRIELWSKDSWEPLGDYPSSLLRPGYVYRRKPAINTHEVNECTVAAPMNREPDYGTLYFVPAYYLSTWYRKMTYIDSASDKYNFQRGLCFATAQGAAENAKAQLGFDPKGSI